MSFGWIVGLLICLISGCSEQMQNRDLASSTDIDSNFLPMVRYQAVSAPTDCSATPCYYIRKGASGSGTGADWTNAFPGFPSSLVRGATYFVAGGSYGSVSFNDALSSTKVITIKKATVADHGTAAGWSDSFGTTQAQFGNLAFYKGYYTFDGVTGGGPGSWETGFGFRVQGTWHTIDFPAAVSNISIRHTDIEGGGRKEASETDLLYLVYPYTNITISSCFLHDTSRTMILSWPSDGTGLLIEYSKFARNGVAEHREAWSAGTDKNVTVRYNLFEDIMGTAFIAIVNSTGVAQNWDIHGNAFYWTGKYTDGIINTGVIMNRYDGAGGSVNVRASNWHIYNNIIANIRGGSFTAMFAPEGPLDTYVVENNIWYNNVGPAGAGGTLVDYNWFYANGSNNKSGLNDIIGSASPFIDAQPWLTGNWSLKAAIPGAALASPYNKDYLGNDRGADGVFDRGAVEFSAGTGSSNPTPVPTATPISTATPVATATATPATPIATATPAIPVATATPLPTAAPVVSGETLLGSSSPTTLDANDGVIYELGMKFTSITAGKIAAIRFYKSPAETSTHTGKIYSSTGTLLASVAFTNESASGWQTAYLATPLVIAANTTYTVSVNTAGGYYAATIGDFAATKSSANLRTPVSGGVYGAAGAMPMQAWQNSNYFRDVIFVASSTATPIPAPSASPASGDTAAPSVTITSPVDGSKVARSSSVTISASASDNIAVTKVEFYVNGVLKCTDTAAPYTCAWAVPRGRNIPYSLQANAYDAAGNRSSSAVVSVTSR
jgi:hypothetical protein